MLVKTSLVAVVSLPAGVFNPYSGVKTSILILDKRLHKQLDSVLFVQVGNDEPLVSSNRELIRRMQAKVKAAIDRVWGEST